jgi:RNA polymerase sigma factor (TIGR02999 family)
MHSLTSRPASLDRLVPLVYDELRALARSHLRRERPDHSLQATALVHEVYLRLLKGADRPVWNDRHHFFVAAAEAMRRILIEHARARGRQKRDGQQVRVELESLDLPSVDLATEHDLDTVLALDDAICRLEKEDPRASEIVRLRFFAGLSVDETADTMGLSTRTVKREWAYARAWLFHALRSAHP